MELEDLGFDQRFRVQFGKLPTSDGSAARVTAVDRDSYLVRNERGEVRAVLAGNLLFAAGSSVDLPCVGDWVSVRFYDSEALAIIHSLLPRRSILRRKTPGKRIDYQVIASNLDVAFIVQSCDSNFNLRRLERYLAMVLEGRIEPRLLLTKGDLVSPEELERRISEVRQANIHCAILALSHITGAGLDQLRRMLEAGRTYCLLGSSGVGKTTILNDLLGWDLYKTAEVRNYDGKGRHTTARRQLIVLDQGAMLIDTPGMRELGSLGVRDGIHESFADLAELSSTCRFTNCTHASEIGCSLLAAVERGDLSPDRYHSYLRLLRETDYHEMSYLERRKKDREFGRFVKSAMKQKKK